MKNTILILSSMLCFLSAFTQELSYNIHGKYANPVTKSKLDQAKILSDVNTGYPTTWITEYIGVEIVATSKGKTVKADGRNNLLTSEQQTLLRSADLGTDIVMNVDYKHRNTITDNLDVFRMTYTVTVVPEVEAEYAGGHEQLMEYVRKNAAEKVTSAKSVSFDKVTVRFTVNEDGSIAGAQLAEPSADPEMDKLVLDAINRMPKWKPAKTATGVKVKQEFECILTTDIGGC